MTERRPPIPTPLRITSEVCARLLVVATAVALLIYLVILLRIVVIPVAISLLLAALLAPAVQWLTVRRVPRGLATALVLVGGLALLGGLLSFVVTTSSVATRSCRPSWPAASPPSSGCSPGRR